jgi:hypothetical protein
VEAWRDALAIWPRHAPLEVVHEEYAADASVFETLEREYVDAVAAFASTVLRSEARCDDDLRAALGRVEQLLAERVSRLGDDANPPRLRSIQPPAVAVRELQLERLRGQITRLGPMPDATRGLTSYLEQYIRHCRLVYPQAPAQQPGVARDPAGAEERLRHVCHRAAQCRRDRGRAAPTGRGQQRITGHLAALDGAVRADRSRDA